MSSPPTKTGTDQTRDIKAEAEHFIQDFLENIDPKSRPHVKLVVHADRRSYGSAQGSIPAQPVSGEVADREFLVHVCEELVQGLPALPFQGWLDRETAKCVLEIRRQFVGPSFSEQIMPLFPVSGSGVNFFRHVVEHLREAAKEHACTELAIELGHGEPQAHLCFFRINCERQESENYRMLLSHRWVRATFLCRKFREYSPLNTLAARNVAFARELKNSWWKEQDYLLEEDRLFLNDLTDLVADNSGTTFADKVIAMFKLLKSHLLVRDRPHETP